MPAICYLLTQREHRMPQPPPDLRAAYGSLLDGRLDRRQFMQLAMALGLSASAAAGMAGMAAPSPPPSAPPPPAPPGPPSAPRGAVAPLAIGPVVVDPPVLQAPMAGYTNYAYRQVVRELFEAYSTQPNEMPASYAEAADLPRATADYIAGMTDRYALDEHRRLFDLYE